MSYKQIIDRIKSYDFNWLDLAELVVSAVEDGDNARVRENKLYNPATVPLVGALRSIYPGLSVKNARFLVDAAITGIMVPNARATYVAYLQRELDKLYYKGSESRQQRA